MRVFFRLQLPKVSSTVDGGVDFSLGRICGGIKSGGFSALTVSGMTATSLLQPQLKTAEKRKQHFDETKDIFSELPICFT